MDIAKTLRESCFCEGRGCELCRAADEIERLRAELALAIDDCRAAQVERDNVRAAYITQIDRLRAELAGMVAQRTAYAREFPPDAEGEPDTGSIHANIRAMKAELAELRHFRKVIMDYDSNLYDALANSDAARKGEGE
jgi:hypothetical protein